MAMAQLQPGDAAARVLEQFKGSLPLTVAELLHLFELLALPGVGLLEYAGLSATSLEAEVDMQCFCDFLFDQHLGHEFRAVSVWHLTHALLPAVEAAGHLATARVYEIEPTVIRPKGYKVRCLRDGRMGSAYVDGIFGPCHAGPASFMLSYTWGYQVGDIAETLNDFCEKHELKPQEAYVWICCLCINQHRVHEASSRGDVVPFEQFERAFGERVSGIGHVIAMMSPWDDPLYISRVWCDFEMFTAICVAKSQVTVVMPPSEAMDLRAELMHGRGIGAVWNTLSKLNVECAQASVSRDRELILEMIQQGPGYHRLNTVIGEHLKEWILCACEGHILRSLEVEELEDDHAIAGLCNEVGSLLISLGYLERAEHLLQEGLRLKEQHLDLEKSADGAELMSNLGEIYEKKGDLEAASQLYQRATRAFQLCSPASTAAMAKATSLRRLGRLRGVQGDLAAKLELYSSARQVLEEAESLQTPEGAVLLNSLGAAKRQEGDLEAALEAYEAALKIHASLQTIDTPEGAALLSNIGVARMKQKKKKKAKQAFEQALTIREKTGTLETTAGATLLTNIAELKALLGDAEGELELYLQAKVIREKTGTLHSAAGAVVLSHLGGIYARREELDVALQWLQLAREAREKSGTLVCEAGARLLAKTAELHAGREAAEEAARLFARAREVREATGTIETDTGVKLFSQMASFYAKRGDFDTAIQAWQDAKKACEAIDEWSKMMGVRLLEQLGALHAEQAARAAELEALQSAAAQREVLEKVTGALASKLFARIAELQLEMGNSSESERFQEKAAAALKKMANIDEVEGETMSAEVV